MATTRLTAVRYPIFMTPFEAEAYNLALHTSRLRVIQRCHVACIKRRSSLGPCALYNATYHRPVTELHTWQALRHRRHDGTQVASGCTLSQLKRWTLTASRSAHCCLNSKRTTPARHVWILEFRSPLQSENCVDLSSGLPISANQVLYNGTVQIIIQGASSE